MNNSVKKLYAQERATHDLTALQLAVLALFSNPTLQDKAAEQLANRDAVFAAAIAWRNKWIDVGDMQEVESGCKCEVCNLIRAVDEATGVTHA